MDGGGSTGNVLSIDQEHEYVIDAIAMHAFGRGFSGLTGFGLDAELMRLDVPVPGTRSQFRKQLSAELQDGLQALAAAHFGRDRREPALDVSLKGVVVARL